MFWWRVFFVWGFFLVGVFHVVFHFGLSLGEFVCWFDLGLFLGKVFVVVLFVCFGIYWFGFTVKGFLPWNFPGVCISQTLTFQKMKPSTI